MKRNILYILFAGVLLSACATPQAQMKKELGHIQVKCNPEVLEVLNNKIEARVNITFPEDFFDKQTMMVFTPVLVYEGGQSTGKAFIYQGEEIMANYKVVPVRGITHSELLSFGYLAGMEQCRLELRSTLISGTKKITLPAIKVADGCNATYRLVLNSGEYSFKDDGYQRVTTLTTETSIMFDVNSSTVRNTTRNNSAVQMYKSYLSDLDENSRYKLTGTQIVAYASPEGGEEYNAKLSDKRAQAAVKTWKELSGGDVDSLEVHSVGQDWEGFKEALENSDLEDKDLILRVLSMYSDPAMRESEIRNLSFIYEDLKREVFPDLRRATFIVEAEHTGFSDEELLELGDKQLGMLSEQEVLRLASISPDREHKRFYYRLAAERYLSEVGYYNLAAIALDDNINDVASAYLDRIPDDPDVLNARGVIELRKGRTDQARNYFLRADNADSRKNLGTLLILEGKYTEAADLLKGSGGANEVLACILTGQIDEAIAASSLESPRDAYLAAVAYARKGDAENVKKALSIACEDELYAQKAAKDVEFVDFR
ncbi:MAG: hypothetical protein ACI3ZK_04310 [Candidatus Cryptobacteroides sp.]